VKPAGTPHLERMAGFAALYLGGPTHPTKELYPH
jgi:hypothetical protein